MDSTLVIKVKYGDTLRRFNSQVSKDGQLDLDMNGLREKIIGLFNFAANADFALTYIDEDGDVVTLVDDNDLLDVMKQKLKFLKVNVQLNNNFAKSSGMISPRVQHPLPDINNAIIADVFKSVPEPFRETLSKLALDLASKATSSSSVMKEYLDRAYKIGPSILNPNQLSQVGTHSGAIRSNSVTSVVPTAPNAVNGQTSVETLEKVEHVRKETSRQNDGKKHVGVGPLSDSNISARPIPYCGPNFHVPVRNDVSAPPHVPQISQPRQWSAGRSGSAVGMFHRGVQCDGCGVHPITGPRYKSKVMNDYDLCSICFAQMGNESDYIKMDRPVPIPRPLSFKGLHDSNSPVPPLSTGIRHCGMMMKPVRCKLDSRFIMDVNVLDGTVMEPSAEFTKIWKMRNSGSASWPQGARLVYIGGDKFSHEVSTELEIPANGLPVDGELDVAVDFTSPELPGLYISYWRMALPSGTKFGQRVWVLIQVDAAKKDSISDGGLNLNMPPDCNSKCSQIIDVNGHPLVDSGLQESDHSAPATELEKPEKDQDVNFPINNYLLVGEGVSTTSPEATSPVSYPIVDLSEALVLSEDVPSSSEDDAKEKSLLKELEQMGFKQVDLNKEVLRLNEYDLEQSVDDLCGVSEWDPILEELQEMGFSDENKNKELLKKNNGSIRRVVMDLLTGEKA